MKNLNNYIKSQRLTYFVLGIVSGYFAGLSHNNYGWLVALGLVVIATILAYWFGRKEK